MNLTFLGTSSGTPTQDRNVTGVALRRAGHWDLFDCGEGTQHRLLATSLSLSRLRRVFISHLHGDHCFGLFGLLSSRAMTDAADALTVYGPPGLEAMVRGVLEASSSYVNYPLEFVTVPAEGGQVVADASGTVDALELDHRVTSLGWCLREAPRLGVFDATRAMKLGVPKGPAFGRLQRGESVTLTDGQVIEPSSVVGASRPGRTLIIAGDNRDPTRLLENTGPVQLLVHEATYTEDVLAELGDDRGHSTAQRVAIAASAAGVENLVLTHFSPRYGRRGSDRHSIEDVRAEATARFAGGLHLASDYDEFTLSPDGRLELAGPDHS